MGCSGKMFFSFPVMNVVSRRCFPTTHGSFCRGCFPGLNRKHNRMAVRLLSNQAKAHMKTEPWFEKGDYSCWKVIFGDIMESDLAMSDNVIVVVAIPNGTPPPWKAALPQSLMAFFVTKHF